MSRRPTAASLTSGVTTSFVHCRARIVRIVLASTSVFAVVVAFASAAGRQAPVDLISGVETAGASPFSPLAEAFKLVFAAGIGALVMFVHRRYPGDKPISRSLAQAQVLLCVAGALMMIIIGNSLARALGIAGGATIVRFRTPVEDPKDTTVLFLLLGLGMASGLGSFAVAGLGAAFLCVCLALLDFVGERKQRSMILEMVSSGSEFPTEYVNRLLSAYRIRFEPREVEAGDKATIRYHCRLDPDTPLQRLSEQLMDAEASGLKSVVWALPKRE